MQKAAAQTTIVSDFRSFGNCPLSLVEDRLDDHLQVGEQHGGVQPVRLRTDVGSFGGGRQVQRLPA